MKWTKQLPTKDGFYFIRLNGLESIIRVEDGQAVVPLVGKNSLRIGLGHSGGIDWAGPIPMPKE